MKNNYQKFVAAYIEAAAWTEEEELNGASDLDPGVFEKSTADCQKFTDENATDLEGLDPAQCGHDFWLTRNGHGTGFWDRGLGERGERLSEAASKFGEHYIYAGDDGKVYSD